jgi:hypothetical protein
MSEARKLTAMLAADVPDIPGWPAPMKGASLRGSVRCAVTPWIQPSPFISSAWLARAMDSSGPKPASASQR